MEALNGIGVIAFIAAFCAGALLCGQVFRGIDSMRHSLRIRRLQLGDSDMRTGTMLLRNGIGPFVPIVSRLMRVRSVKGYLDLLVYACRLRGWEVTAEGLGSILCAVVLALCAVGLVAAELLPLVAIAAAVLVACGMAARQTKEAELRRLREEIPGVLHSMNACLHAGYTLLQTFRQVARESEGAIGVCFERAAAGLETGKTTEQVLEELRREMAIPELGFVIVAMEVQHRAGGSLRQIVDAAGDAVEEELALQRALQVQTAQARLSARLVTVMPFVLLAIISLLTEDFLAPFFSSLAGMAVLGVAIAMQVAGVLVVRRLLNVEEG